MKKEILNPYFLGITLLIFILLEIVFARLAFYTLGEVSSGLYFIAIALNLVPLYLLLFKLKKKAIMSTIFIFGLVLFLAIVPYQMYLGNQLRLLQEEAANLTAYAYQQRIETGTYPADLSDYTFTFPELKSHFNYESEGQDQFNLSYHVGSPTTSYYLEPTTKKWFYYQD